MDYIQDIYVYLTRERVHIRERRQVGEAMVAYFAGDKKNSC